MLRKSLHAYAVWGLLALPGFACGGGGDATADAGAPDASDPNTDADPSDLCAEFAAPASTMLVYPTTFDGTLTGAGADIGVQDASCAVEEAPFGVQAPGPDRVVALRDLTPGSTYAIRLFSGGDLAFYVATSCSQMVGGPVGSECLLYVDASTLSPERGLFVAPDDGVAYVVIDFFLSGDPSEMEFSLEVYEQECESSDECGGGTPSCVDNRCVQCETSFDCSDPGLPVCDARSNACAGPFEGCVNDDDAEGGDDGPAGATDLTPSVTTVADTGTICDSPTEEVDYYQFTVATAGEWYTIDLEWADPAIDLELTVFDDTGERVGLSLWERPEQVALTYLPAGTYYAMVDHFGEGETATTDYTITATRTTGLACSTAADCATEFRNQIFRGDCQGGACVSIDGAGALGDGARCDSSSDCLSTQCTSFFFNEDADTRSVCTLFCTEDNECASLGADYVCTDFLVDNVCVQKCTSSQQCPVLLSVPPTSGPWEYLTCEAGTGRCRL